MTCILVLEDDDAFRETLVDTLTEEGYEVLPAASSQQALSLAAAHEIRLLVTDVRMAGADGIETVTRLRERYRDLRSIVMTGYASDSAPVRAIQAEVCDYLYKPFGLDELTTIVSRVLDSQKESQGYRRVLARLRAGAQAVVTRARLHRLDRERHKAFQAFFVAVRAKLLNQRLAHERWQRLLALDERREALRSLWSHADAEKLEADYRALASLLAGKGDVAPLKGSPSSREQVRFGGLFMRILAGRLSVEQLKLAPALLEAPADGLAASRKLAALQLEIWGP